MARFNVPSSKPPIKAGPIITRGTVPTLRTGEGAPGYKRDALSELFLLACSNFVGQDTFYEKGKVRDERYLELIREAVKVDFGWVCRFVPWLRNNANMRTAATILAVEAVRARLAITGKGHPLDQRNRNLISSVLVRADEPGEMLAYYIANYGRNVPRPIKRGIADAAGRLFTQRNVIKYDTNSKAWSFGGIIEFTGPVPEMRDGVDLFKYLVTKSKRRWRSATQVEASGEREVIEIPESQAMLRANLQLRTQASVHRELLLNTARLRQAGMTWEAAKSLAGAKVSARSLWEALIPEMGYMALLRNLRNFDEVGVKDDAIIASIIAKLTDPAEVMASRQLPMRFLSAYRTVPSSRWAQPLETALQLSLQSVPQLPGSTLIMIDTSGSMNADMPSHSDLKYWDAAAIFGLALAQRCQQVQVAAFSTGTMIFPMRKGASLLKALDEFRNGGYFMGGGTYTAQAVAKHYQGHDRVIILTDEQLTDSGSFDPFPSVPADKQMITFNLAGYEAAQNMSNINRISLGGLSDAAFTLLGSLDSRRSGSWPF